MEEFLNKVIFNNTVENYAWFTGIILTVILLGRPITRLLITIIYQVFKKIGMSGMADEFKKLLQKPLTNFLILFTVYVSFDLLRFPTEINFEVYGVTLQDILYTVYELIIVVSVTWIFIRLVDFIVSMLEAKAAKTETKEDDQIAFFVRDLLKIVVVIVAFFFIFGVIFKLDISGLLAGAGIAGLAIAFAAKDSLENLFGSFTIFTDKPFTVGDFIQVGDVVGTVEKVGFRSTRIRTLDKTFVTVPNRKIMDSHSENLTLRTFRRVKMTVGLTYDTKKETIKKIVDDIQAFIDKHELTNQDGIVGFYDFGESSLDVLVIYYVQNMDWKTYINTRERINFKIMDIVETHKSDFAFPTRTLYMQKED